MQNQFWVGAGFVIVALILLDVLNGTTYGIVIPVAALILMLAPERLRALPSHSSRPRVDRQDVVAMAALYLAVVFLFRLAFVVFTVGRVTGLFLIFATALVLGVGGPVIYTVGIRRRPLASLGVGLHNWRRTAVLGVVFAGVQFSITLWGYDLPRPVDWVPLLAMALTVGVFESVFFRGFVQGRLEESLGVGPAVFGAAALYALYHFGYGMAGAEMLFLFGLGVAYAIAYRLTENILVLWPLLTPLGSFFSQLRAGDLAGQLPWASIAGFGDVLLVMGVVIWLAYRAQRRRALVGAAA